MDFIIKIFQHLFRKKTKFSRRSRGFIGSSSRSDTDDQNGCFNCQKPDHYIAECPDLHKDKSKKGKLLKEQLQKKFQEKYHGNMGITS